MSNDRLREDQLPPPSQTLSLSQVFNFTSQPTPSVIATWPARPELSGTPAQAYRGPLRASDVLNLLAVPDLRQNARLALTGTPGGYLKYFHFLGIRSTPPARKRRRLAVAQAPVEIPALTISAASPSQGVTETADSTAAEANSSGDGKAADDAAPGAAMEWWRCRACHTELHVKPGKATHLGTHLYGSEAPQRRGCLELRRHSPAEAIPPVDLDSAGRVVRIRPDKPLPSVRAARTRRHSTTTTLHLHSP
ncbi:hypothetical protein V8E36_004695 [Tilletia maclaganii]